MELTITTLTGEIAVTVTVTRSTTIGELKRLVESHCNVPPSRQKLSKGQNVTLEDNSRTVQDYGLISGSTVILLILPRPVPLQVIVVNDKKQQKPYDITENETVAELERKVSKEENIPVGQFYFVHEGKGLSPGGKLKDYNIKSGSTIYMLLRLRGG